LFMVKATVRNQKPKTKNQKQKKGRLSPALTIAT
jgi:hypothetical protein